MKSRTIENFNFKIIKVVKSMFNVHQSHPFAFEHHFDATY